MKCLLELGGVPTTKDRYLPSFFYLAIFTNFRLTLSKGEMVYHTTVIWNLKNSACMVKLLYTVYAIFETQFHYKPLILFITSDRSW